MEEVITYHRCNLSPEEYYKFLIRTLNELNDSLNEIELTESKPYMSTGIILHEIKLVLHEIDKIRMEF